LKKTGLKINNKLFFRQIFVLIQIVLSFMFNAVHAEETEKKKDLLSQDAEPEYEDYVLSDMESQLRKFSSKESGIFSVNYFDSQTIVQDTFGDTAVRKVYDKNRRLIHLEGWKISSNSSDSEKEFYEDYYYIKNERTPEKCITINLKEKHKLETLFNEKGLKISEKRFSLEDESEGKDDKKESKKESKIEESNTWKYDGSRRLIENEKITYLDKNKKNIQKNVYDYKIEGEEPDYTFYENGLIRLKRVYSAPGEYKETAYFDNGFCVESYFKHGIKTEVLQKAGGQVVNRVVYEKE